MSYNGWSNWETWNVSLWVDNKYEDYKTRVEMERWLGPWTPAKVKQFVCDLYPNGTPDMDDPDDIKGVDFSEIAESWNAGNTS